MTKLRVLDLFSGIGGFSLGLERTGGFETVAFCEIEEYPRKVLRKHWPSVPLFGDVRELKGTDVGAVDVICGGYPCQPFSTAGKRGGEKDDRHLWPEFSRLVAELRPTWVIGENVAGHISLGLDDVLSDLEGQGYTCRTFVIPACGVGAPHQRYRCWVVGHTSCERRGEEGQHSSRPKKWPAGASASRQTPANPRGVGRQGWSNGRTVAARAYAEPPRRAIGRTLQSRVTPDAFCGERPQCGPLGRMGRQEQVSWDRTWPIASQPLVRRGTHGVPNRMDRLKALGNAVVPQIPEMIGHAILAAMQTDEELVDA